MAKRIHQIAKELNVSSKEIINFLKGKIAQEKEKTASSGLSDEEVALVEKQFKKEKKEEAPSGKPAEEKAPQAAGTAPKPAGAVSPATGGHPGDKAAGANAGDGAASANAPKPAGLGTSVSTAHPENRTAGADAGTPASTAHPENKTAGANAGTPAASGHPENKTAGANAGTPAATARPENRTTSANAGERPAGANSSKPAGAGTPAASGHPGDRPATAQPKKSEPGRRTPENEKGPEDAQRTKKKSRITAVFNPQNSQLGKNKRPNKRRGSNNGRPQQERSYNKAENPEDSLRPGFERISSKAQLKERAAANSRNQKNLQPKPAQPAKSQEMKSAEAKSAEAKSAAAKPVETKAEEKPAMPTDRMKLENAIKRPVVKIQGNIYSNMNKKPEGRQNENRAEYSGKSGSREKTGGRNFQNNKGAANHAYADRGNSRFHQNRKTEGRGRLDQEITRFHQNAVQPGPEEAKSGRDSRDRDRNNKKNRKSYESGGRKQERFTNLEKNAAKRKNKQQQQPKVQEKVEDVIKTLILPDSITIKDLADKMKMPPSALIKKLFLQGKIVTVNQEVDFDTAEEIALEFNCICEHEVKVDVIEELLREEEEDESLMVPRPPVVCVMGHVDHGKTSLLDAIRETRVTDREAGGITQHIGASVVEINGQTITFLDTPGHEAFTAMRMRGANSTDIAILVVAADDGVMPQTIEAINHAKAAGIEIIVAINKIDKPSANVERVKQELSEYELVPEDWGGNTIFVPVSAHTHEGIDQLLEMILLTAEICELKANPNRAARGLVIEAQLDKGRGTVATVLVQKGTLKVGDPVAAGSCYGKVRAMIDDKGKRVKEAGPSTPVEILGLSSVPNAGEILVSTATEKEARSFADTFVSQNKEKLLEETKSKMSLDDLFSQIQAGNLKELDIIVKADVQGSVEAVRQSLEKLSNDEVVVKIIHGGVGAINESDVILASASNAIVIGFNVRPDSAAKETAEREGVDVRLYKVIYNAIEDVEAAMKGMLDPIFEEKVLGHAEIRQIFKASGIGNIAGSYVMDGVFERGCKIRVMRAGEQLFDGNLASLKRFKDDVKEVRAGYECGLVFEGFQDFTELDTVEAYKMVEVPR